MLKVKLPSELKSTKNFINSSILCKRVFTNETLNEFCDQVRHFITVFNQKIDEGTMDELKTIDPIYPQVLYITPLPSNDVIKRAYNVAMIANKAAKDIWFWNLSEQIRWSLDLKEFNHFWIQARSLPIPTQKSPLPFLKNLLSPKSFSDLRAAAFSPYTNLLSYLRVPYESYAFSTVFDLTEINHGKPLMLHLTYGSYTFDDEYSDDYAWEIKRISYTRDETEWVARLEKLVIKPTKPADEPIAHRTRSKCKL